MNFSGVLNVFYAELPLNPEREPIFNAPWPPLALTAVIVAGYGLQAFTPDNAGFFAYAFSPRDLQDGRWITLFTSLFIHGSWGHALMNAAFVLAFGTPLARYLGSRPGGAGLFFLFYLASGALASLGFGLVHAGQAVELVGASGAASGLAGAAARLIAGRGEIGRIWSPVVIGMGASWLIVNLLIAVVGFAPGAGGAPVAWEAHIFGFAAGVLLCQLLKSRGVEA